MVTHPALVTKIAARRRLGVGWHALEELIRTGRLSTVTIGKRVLVTRASLDRLAETSQPPQD